uniref:Uncharacterized protein n=1 Tax=Cacopsylla melanoneura TaxID=428564 RepID=A0A8D8ZC83_9HEMI
MTPIRLHYKRLPIVQTPRCVPALHHTPISFPEGSHPPTSRCLPADWIPFLPSPHNRNLFPQNLNEKVIVLQIKKVPKRGAKVVCQQCCSFQYSSQNGGKKTVHYTKRAEHCSLFSRGKDRGKASAHRRELFTGKQKDLFEFQTK